MFIILEYSILFDVPEDLCALSFYRAGSDLGTRGKNPFTPNVRTLTNIAQGHVPTIYIMKERVNKIST